ncbi:MAG: hypothetical protein K9I85_13145 [Saprospiraceae bacterium]|nr:hypothetical protein [Saprospiraceae bacterium]
MVSLIQQWRNRWGYWRLRKESLSKPRLTAPVMSLPPKSALILFCADKPSDVSAMKKLASLWEKRHMQVTILGYYPDKLDHPESEYSYFNRKAMDLNGEPRGEVVDAIIKKPVDLLIQVCTETVLPLDWIAFRVAASIKIAPAPALEYYGLQLDGHDNDSLSMILRADSLLDMLKSAAHAFA